MSARLKSSRRQARPARSSRIACAEIRYRKLVLPTTIEGTEPIAVSVVHVRETSPPTGEKAVEWFLLTSINVDSPETAIEIIGYYLQRWRVEDFFRLLKSGCRVEHLAFRTADQLQRAITLNAVIAWRPQPSSIKLPRNSAGEGMLFRTNSGHRAALAGFYRLSRRLC